MKTSLLITVLTSFVFFGCAHNNTSKDAVLKQQLSKNETMVKDLSQKCEEKMDENTRAIEKLSQQHKKSTNKVTVKKKKVVQTVLKKKVIAKKPTYKVGEQICRHSKGLGGFIDINLVGKIVTKTNDMIKVKIVDSYGEDGKYMGLHLYRNMVVHDKENNWKLCKK